MLSSGRVIICAPEEAVYQGQHIINILIGRAYGHSRADGRGLDKAEVFQAITFPSANPVKSYYTYIVYTNSRSKSILFIFRR